MPRPKPPAGPGRPPKPPAEKYIPNTLKLSPEVDGLLTAAGLELHGGNRSGAAAHAIRIYAAGAGLDPIYRDPEGRIRRRKARPADLVPPRARADRGRRGGTPG